MNKTTNKVPENVLCVSAGDMKVCIDVMATVKILLLPYIDHSPIKSSSLVGMLNYHGQSICVIDLYALLTGRREVPYTLDNPVIMVKSHDEVVGLVVDEIDDVRKVDPSTVQYSKEIGSNDSLIEASIIFDGEFYLLLKQDFYQLGKVAHHTDNNNDINERDQKR